MNAKRNITQQSKPHTLPTLVLGGNGKTGRRIVERLEARGVPVRIGSRTASPEFNWDDPDGWDTVLRGMQALFIAYYPDLAVHGASEQIRELVARAKAQRLRKVVLLSGRGEEEAQLCERIVLNCGIPATIVRCSWFNQNFTESFLRDMVMSGTIALPVSSVREPFVDVEDIADVAVAALTSDGHAGRVYEITGPRLMTFAEVAREIALASGRKVEFVEIPREEFVSGLKAAKLPEPMVNLIDYLVTVVLDGRNESLGDGVQQALGKEPRDFRDFVRSSMENGAWA